MMYWTPSAIRAIKVLKPDIPDPYLPTRSAFGNNHSKDRLMPRFFERCRRFDLAATLLVVLVAVWVADVNDYGAHPHAMLSSVCCSPVTSSEPSELTPASADSESDPEHVCSCILCVETLPHAFGPQILPLSAGKLPQPLVADPAPSSHVSEVFHPPSV